MLSKIAKKTKDQLKRLFPIQVVVLLSMIMTACGHGKVKREVEIWFIDNKELLLFRQIQGGNEQIIPLKSKSMDRFMCIDKQEAQLLIGDLIEEE